MPPKMCWLELRHDYCIYGPNQANEVAQKRGMISEETMYVRCALTGLVATSSKQDGYRS